MKDGSMQDSDDRDGEQHGAEGGGRRGALSDPDFWAVVLLLLVALALLA